MKNAYGKYLDQNKKSYTNCIIFSPSKDDCFGISNINNKKQNHSISIDNNPKNNNIKSNIQINNNCNETKNINRNNTDPRIELVFKYLSIEKNLPIFINNNINFTDLLVLSRNDLIDLGLSMIDRNRILYFSQQFLKYAKNYSINEINSFFQENKNLYDNTISNNTNRDKNINNSNNSNNNNNNKYFEYNTQRYNNKQKNENENQLLVCSNGFESNNNKKSNNNKNDVINNYTYKNIDKDKDKERDSQQELDYCNIFPAGCISQSRTNTSSKNNNNSLYNKVDYFSKYQELTQEVDNYMFKFNEYKQNWNNSKKKYDNLMNSYLVRGKSSTNKKNKKNKKIKNAKNWSHNDKIRDKKSININKESLEKLKKLKERKEELKKQLEKIKDKSNHKKMIINYIDEN
jgi:hypothetical protein